MYSRKHIKSGKSRKSRKSGKSRKKIRYRGGTKLLYTNMTNNIISMLNEKWDEQNIELENYISCLEKDTLLYKYLLYKQSNTYIRYLIGILNNKLIPNRELVTRINDIYNEILIKIARINMPVVNALRKTQCNGIEEISTYSEDELTEQIKTHHIYKEEYKNIYDEIRKKIPKIPTPVKIPNKPTIYNRFGRKKVLKHGTYSLSSNSKRNNNINKYRKIGRHPLTPWNKSRNIVYNGEPSLVSPVV